MLDIDHIVNYSYDVFQIYILTYYNFPCYSAYSTEWGNTNRGSGPYVSISAVTLVSLVGQQKKKILELQVIFCGETSTENSVSL